ncbi:anthranilate synthase component I family protein [Hydrogenimonas cancrithermarum]|uniref:Anthranilate synthase component 1 n=1 Tax=Hydrogenimonas cancrithermarum TaxID=2993563 RepID=A0ABN6WT28_9BACT|nr:anthranilate synthase component I family protein [Hydrogenimonas cancrithermarum]BDY12294.1 anthranilate synthase component I [Hydrogenimonas cancrithermarum]
MVFVKKILFDQFAPPALYAKIREHFNNDVTMLFESVGGNDEGNFSFIFIGAKERLIYKENTTTYIDEIGNRHTPETDPFSFLKSYYANIDQDAYKTKRLETGLGFLDGFIGYIGYDMVKVFEPVLKPYMDALEDRDGIPDFDMIRPKLVLAFSHKTSELSLITSDESTFKTFDALIELIESPYEYMTMKPIEKSEGGEFAFDEAKFHKMVDDSKEMIRSGDVFQILMSNRYVERAKVDPFSFYRILRSKNPSPYLFLLEFEDFSIAGSSPEVMVRLTDGNILLRPIAGTRKRGKTIDRDKEMEEEMLSDPKERAEHIMLVDLGRNDVGRVAKAGTVKVTALMRVERYSHVMHMVSDVEAKLDDGKDMFDLFAATFTAGTMTGAPKIRAMELIAEFEGIKRGFYSGSVGYFGFDGNMDSSITIRTALVKPEEIVLQAGAGVVADSKPELEYLEVKNKLAALRSTLDDLRA